MTQSPTSVRTESGPSRLDVKTRAGTISGMWEMEENERRIAIAKRAAKGAARTLGRRDVLLIERTVPQYPVPQIVLPVSGRRWKRILAEVAIEHGIPPALILGKQRQRQIAAARHHAMYRISQETDMSMAEIGRHMGRDHTTVIAGVKAHRRRIAAQALSEISPLSTVFTGPVEIPLTQAVLRRDASS